MRVLQDRDDGRGRAGVARLVGGADGDRVFVAVGVAGLARRGEAELERISPVGSDDDCAARLRHRVLVGDGVGRAVGSDAARRIRDSSRHGDGDRVFILPGVRGTRGGGDDG